MATVEERHGSEALQLCQGMLEWCRTHGVHAVWGRGEDVGSMGAEVRAAGARHTPFRLYTRSTGGRVEIDFQQLKSHPPFADEELRRQLLEGLNAIPGVQLPADSLALRPFIDFYVLQRNEGREGFLSVMEWAVTMIRQRG